MTQRVTIIIPTFNRLEGLKALCHSILAHMGDYPHDVLVMIDGGHVETYRWACGAGYNVFMSCRQRWYVATMNTAVSLCETDLFCYLNDDMLITQVGWLENAVKQFQGRFPDNIGLLKFTDGIQSRDGTAACGMTSKDFVRAVYQHKTPFLWPEYKHFAADTELTAIAKDIGLFLPTDIFIEHVRKDGDPLYKARGSNYMTATVDGEREHWQHDVVELFAERQKAGFPI